MSELLEILRRIDGRLLNLCNVVALHGRILLKIAEAEGYLVIGLPEGYERGPGGVLRRVEDDSANDHAPESDDLTWPPCETVSLVDNGDNSAWRQWYSGQHDNAEATNAEASQAAP